MSKLYTEEQLLNTIKSVQYYIEHYDKSVLSSIIEKHLKALSPIQIPTDEDVYQEAKNAEGLFVNWNMYETSAFVMGAQWMKNKIKGGQDE